MMTRSTALVGLFGVLGLGAAQALWYAFPDQPLWGGLAVLVGLAARLWGIPPSSPQVDSIHLPSPQFSIKLLGFGALSMALVFYTARQALYGGLRAEIALGLWGVAILLALLSITSFADWRQTGQLLVSTARHENREWALLMLMVGIGLGVRTIGTGSFPSMMAEDEGYFAWGAVQLNTDQNPFAYDIQHHPYGYQLLQRLSIELLGQTVSAARLPSAVLGTLMILGVYAAGRWLFDRRIGWLAALFMLFFPLQWHFSRIGLNQLFDPTFAIWGMALLWWGIKNNNRLGLAFAGIGLGLSQYGYSAARLIPLLAIFYSLALLLQYRPAWKPLLASLAITAWVAGITVFPQAYFLQQNPFEGLSPRLGDVSLFSDQARNRQGELVTQVDWPDQVQQALLGFVGRKDASIFYGPFDPFLGWIDPLFALIGLAYALRHWREGRYTVLIVWWAGTALFGGILLTNPPEFQRYVIATPALALLVGIGIRTCAAWLVWLSDDLTPQQPIPPIVAQWVLPTLLVMALGAVHIKRYAVDYRLEKPYFGLQRIQNLNHLADEVYPHLDPYTRLWYIPARDLNLTTSPVLFYKAPLIRGEEYLSSPEAFPLTLAQATGPQTVILAVSHPLFDAFYSSLSALPEAEMTILLNPNMQNPYAVMFYFAVPPLPSVQ